MTVRAAAVNPIDWKVRSGVMGGDLPQTTGREVAGVVDELGDGVSDVAPGEEVFGFAAGGGGAAELALLADYAPVPPSLDFTAASALPVAVETAVRTLDLLGVESGSTVLINGAAGGVGSSAVQIARGVDAALDAAGGGALAALIELVGGPERVVTIADYAGAEDTGAVFSGGLGTRRAVHALRDVGELIRAGRFSLPVDRTFPLERIADAHELSEAGHVRGKLVLVVG